MLAITKAPVRHVTVGVDVIIDVQDVMGTE